MASQQPSKASQRHPAWSDESSETEYTSSESEEAPAQEKGNWAESQLTDGPRCGTPPIEAALAPSTAPRNVSLKKVFIDLGDSDEEIDQPVQDLVVLEVRTPKAKLVVDLSDNTVTPSSVEHVEADKELVMESQMPAPCSSPEVPRVALAKESEDEGKVSVALPEEPVLLNTKESEDEGKVSVALPEEPVLLNTKESEDEGKVSVALPEEPVLLNTKESEDEGTVLVALPEEPVLLNTKESEDEGKVSVALPEEPVLLNTKESEDEGTVLVALPEETVLLNTKESEDEGKVSVALPEELGLLNTKESEDEGKVSVAQPAEVAAEESEDEASTISGNYKRAPGLVEVFQPDWSRGALCDMCGRGPSLSLGAWYSWCCGKPSRGCDCTHEDQLQKRKALTGKSVKKPQANDNLAHVWSGKVHRLCALWSAEVYQNDEEPWVMMELEAAMRRSRKFKCSAPDCGRLGATLGCRVKSCRKIFHYPCADRLSVYVKVRTWDGYVKPVACKDHRHEEGKQRKRKRAKPTQGEKALNANANEFGSSDEEGSLHGPTVFDTPVRGPWRARLPQHMGKKLLAADFSYGCEPIPVPCTNDVDDESPPYVEYLTKTRFRNFSLGSKDCPQPPPDRLAKACRGCAQLNLDDPFAPLSVHVPFERREDDDREDWLEERMYGRLPYDKHGRLLIGAKFNELVECNERCECGELCSNRELQKGLTTPLELYKTENKGWALRTLVAIARGKFVIEYVGEMMDHDQAQRYGQEIHYIESKRSYLLELDYPESKRTPDFVLDAFYASNVARFINHSCDPNLKMFRVYVETTYKWLPHIGFYAMRDIEAGEELAYNYNYGRLDEENEQEKHLTHVKCYCGAEDCREWLLVHTDVES